MNDELHKQIYNNMNLKDTDELLEIWQANDRVEWTEEAFECIRVILQKRMGEIPLQDEPVLTHVDQETYSVKYDDETPVEEEYQPVHYKPVEVTDLEKTIKIITPIAVGAAVLSGLLKLPVIQSYLNSGTFKSFELGIEGSWAAALAVFVIEIVLNSIFIIIGLRGLALILKILMQMEINSRGEKLDGI